MARLMYQLRRAVVYVTSSCQLGTAGFAPVLARVPMGHVVVGNRLDLDCLLAKEGGVCTSYWGPPAVPTKQVWAGGPSYGEEAKR